MKKLLMLAALLLSTPMIALAAEWKVQELGHGVSAQFPETPSLTQPKDGIQLFQTKTEVAGERYALVVVASELPSEMIKSEKGREEAYDGMIESMEKRGTVQTNESIDFQGAKARKFTAALASDVKMHGLSFVVDGHLYLFQFVAQDGGAITQEAKDTFFNSIRIAKDPGKPAANPAARNQAASSDNLPDPRRLGNAFGKWIVIAIPILAVLWYLRRRKRQP